MSKEVDFIKTTVIAGLVIMLPIVAVLALFGFFLNAVINVVAPLAGKLPIKTFGGFAWATVFAIFLLVACCFLAGLFVQMRVGRLTQEWVETSLLRRVPGYYMFKNLTRQLVGQAGLEFTPALVDVQGSGALVIGLIVEEHPEGYFTIFVPSSPTVTLGHVYFLPGDRIHKVEGRLVDAVNCLTQWGMESQKLFQAPLKGLERA
jgi:uncharacterized membrane protein